MVSLGWISDSTSVSWLFIRCTSRIRSVSFLIASDPWVGEILHVFNDAHTSYYVFVHIDVFQ
jgi:hypothetical protein